MPKDRPHPWESPRERIELHWPHIVVKGTLFYPFDTCHADTIDVHNVLIAKATCEKLPDCSLGLIVVVTWADSIGQ